MHPTDPNGEAPIHKTSPDPNVEQPHANPLGPSEAVQRSRAQTLLTRRIWPATLRPWLRTPMAHVLRELRDQRSVLLGVFLALPVLTVLAFWAFADRLVEAPVDTAAGGVPPIALGLFLLAVVGDVFAGESRRGTIAFLRRLPGGLRQAFTAKLLVTLAGSVLTVVWQALLLWICWWLWSRSYVPTAGGVIHAALTSPILLPVAAVGAFVLLASTWLQHGGMAILLAPMLLGVLLAPAVVWGRAHPVLGRWALGHEPWHELLPVAVGIAGAAILAAAASFLGGRRVVRSAWAAAWRGLAVLLVLIGGTYAYGAWRVHDVVDFQPGDDGVLITKAFLGRGGRTLFVDAENSASERGRHALSRVWVVDLETGGMRPLAGFCQGIGRPPHAGCWGTHPYMSATLEPLATYVQEWIDSERQLVESWIDGATGEVRKVVSRGLRTPDIFDWTDQSAALATRTHDAEGRRVWLRSRYSAQPGDPFGRPALCAEGQEPRVFGDASLRLWMASSYPAAWLVRPFGEAEWSVLDPDDGTLRPVPEAYGRPQVLSPTRCLWQGRRADHHKPSGWHLIDLAEGTEPRLAPGLDPTEAAVVGVLDADCVLTLAGDPGSRVLCTWDPDTGSHEPLGWSSPWPSPLLPAEQASKLRYAGIVGYRADGSVVLLVGWGDADPSGHHPAGATGASLITVDRPTRTATCIVKVCDHHPRIVAYESDGAVTVIEQERRIVRWGPEPGERKVLFPR